MAAFSVNNATLLYLQSPCLENDCGSQWNITLTLEQQTQQLVSLPSTKTSSHASARITMLNVTSSLERCSCWLIIENSQLRTCIWTDSNNEAERISVSTDSNLRKPLELHILLITIVTEGQHPLTMFQGLLSFTFLTDAVPQLMQIYVVFLSVRVTYVTLILHM